MVEIRSGILNEHVKHLFAICQQISLNSGFRENGRLTARNPLVQTGKIWSGPNWCCKKDRPLMVLHTDMNYSCMKQCIKPVRRLDKTLIVLTGL